MSQSGSPRAPSPSKRSDRPSLGLALSGGGARGLAHIGVLKVLVRERIPIDCLAGTSMGGLVAAAHASGMCPTDIERLAMSMAGWRNRVGLADVGLPHQGLFKGDRLLDFFDKHLGYRRFEDLDLPLALVAADLNSGREIVLREGSVALAVRATVAVPGILAPVELRGCRLADGGLLNNVPADVPRLLGAQMVIAVDVSAPDSRLPQEYFRWAPDGVTSTLKVLNDSIGVMMRAMTRRRLEDAHPDVLIRPDLPDGVSGLSGFDRAAEAIRAGEQAAEAALPRIRELVHHSVI